MAEQSGVYVRFHNRSVPDVEATARDGRPRFKEVPYIEKIVAGDPKNIVHRPANPLDEQAHPGAWEAYKKGVETVDGTPLKEWPGITRSQVDELAAFKVHTVEQLAGVSDANLKNIGPLLAMRQRARDYLERSKAEAPVANLQAQLDALKLQNAELMKRLEEPAKRK